MNERQLVAKILQGDSRAFEHLVGQYEKLAFYMICRMIKNEDDAADVCQEVFIKVYQGLEKFSFQSKLGTWIARVAYLTSLNYLRKYKREVRYSFESGEQELEDYNFNPETPEELMIKKDVSAYVQHLMLQLPLAYRTVLTLFYLEEFNLSEIQEITGMPEGTVKNYLFRAKKILKEKIQHYQKND